MDAVIQWIVVENRHGDMLCLAVVKLNQAQYQHLADKLMDSANIFLASLVVGQFVEQSIQWMLVIMGLVTYGVLIVVTTILRKKGGES